MVKSSDELVVTSALALEWPLLVDHLSDFAAFEETKKHFEETLLTGSVQDTEELFDLTDEMLGILASGAGYFRFQKLHMSQTLEDLRLGRVLTALELLNIRKLIEVSLQASAFVTSRDNALRKRQYPKVAQKSLELKPSAPLAERLLRSVGDNGELLDSASPELGRARAVAAQAERRLVTELERLLASSQVRDALQDPVWMLRDGRYVLPVRTDRKSSVDGVTVAVSQTGSTLFVEPASLGVTKASLDAARRDVQIEEAMVLADLTRACREKRESLEQDATILWELDGLVARAELARRLGATRPVLGRSHTSPLFEFEEIRHPLFILESKPCVPHTIRLAHHHAFENEHSGSPNKERKPRTHPCILVLSGPNAGGKTVTMKTFGLAALMARAGLFIPARKATIFAFDSVFAAIGDSQDRMEDLSTFSAHLSALHDIMKASVPRSMVLLDEGFVGTDPAMGAALARSVLEDFAAKGVCTIITTHFSELKTIADENEAFMNASMEFEQRQLRPTYRLLAGIPGQSFALELAARMDFAEGLLSRAKDLHGREAGRLEKLLGELQMARTEVEEEKIRQANLRRELEAARADVQGEKRKLATLRSDLAAHYESQLQKRLNSFRNTLEVRERQFEKRKAQLLADIEFERERLSRESQATPAVSNEGENHSPSPGHASQTQKLAASPGPSAPPHPSGRPVKAAQRPNKTGTGPNEKGSAPTPGKGQPLRDFASLAKLRLERGQRGPSTSGSKNPPAPNRKWLQGSKWNTDDVDELLEDLTFDPDKPLGELEDEAATELEILKEEMNALKSKMDHDIENVLLPLKKKREHSGKNLSTDQDFGTRHRLEDFQPGAKVSSKGFRGRGEVLVPPNAKGLVSCQFGSLGVKIPVHELEILEKAPKAPSTPVTTPKPHSNERRRRQSPAGTASGASLDESMKPISVFSSRTLNLRGLTVDVALDKADLFLDRMIREEVDSCVIVHGHGSGSLKKAIRQWISELPLPCRYRPGTQGEGGDGATVIVFR